MLTPKASKPSALSSRSPKPQRKSRRIATTRTASGPSKRKVSRPSPVPANTQHPDIIRTLVVDCRDSSILRDWNEIATWGIIIAIDYNHNVFRVVKNQWGECVSDMPLGLLGTFLYNPTVSDARDLTMIQIEHNNLFATRAPEQ